MSSNQLKRVFVTKGHHVCRKSSKAYLLEHAPFKSVCQYSDNGSIPYLGEGFYFWDDNIERAHRWGKEHYNGEYVILEYPLEFKGMDYLDLVGSRQDLMKFSLLMERVQKEMDKGQATGERLAVAQCIAFLQKMNKEKAGVFPYKAVRVVDLKSRGNRIVCFVKNKVGQMPLNPCYIICVYAKDAIPVKKAQIL